ncbi:MAG: hypothetical protein HOP11_01935 [Saprospiraceae bacterium]|nr:hypothetical protein [Saprospiraceae bacterium]
MKDIRPKQIFRIIVFALFAQVGFSQNYPSFDKYWEPITESFQKENYYQAYELISQALKYQKMTDTLHHLAAESAFKLNAFGKSEMHIRQILNNPYGERHQELYKIFAETMMYTGRYGEASNAYKTYLPMTTEGTPEHELISQRIQQTSWAKENNNNKNPLVKTHKVETGINTIDNEFGAFVHNSSLYYSGLRKNSQTKKSKEQYLSKLYKVDQKSGDPMPLDSGLIDNAFSGGNPSFSKDHSKFLYTVCQQLENSTQLQCKVYMKTYNNGKWSVGKMLPEQINLSGYSSTQATIVEDGELYKIYYSSNRPGGKGGYDIWSSLIEDDGSCSIPENLEYLNTMGDEHSPFYSPKSKSLFFSSNFHFGFGGLDVFKYSWKGSDSLKVMNLGRSVNSSYDEYCYSPNFDESISYLSSNRPGSNYLDQNLQACCYDIYKVSSTPRSVDLIVTILDAYDSLEVSGSTISLIDITDRDTLVSVVSMPEKSMHTFTLIEDHKYKIIATKNNYIGDSLLISTMDLYSFDPIKRNLYITQGKQLDISTFEKTTNFTLKGVTIQVWDIDRNLLVSQTSNVDTNQFNFNIYKGRNYKLIASKPKYEPDTLLLLASKISLENPVQRKMFLELSAIAELRRLLPIRLFFDNDMPNPKSEADTTDVLFSKIYNEYSAKKGVYMYQFADVLRGSERTKAILEIDTFFDKNVKLNGDKLLIFLDKLSIIMEEGHSIDIFLKGFASPRAKSEYNQHLSARRVASIRNEFDYYRSGVFHNYIVNENLKIKEIPFGESQSTYGVSDNIEDTRNSIYNLKAAYERRVEILEILKGVDDGK